MSKDFLDHVDGEAARPEPYPYGDGEGAGHGSWAVGSVGGNVLDIPRANHDISATVDARCGMALTDML